MQTPITEVVRTFTDMEPFELAVRGAVQWLRLGVETTGAIIVAIGVLTAIKLFLRALISRKTTNFNAIRLVLARYLALALEFQLGADILSTAIAPGWMQIGQLGAVAIIRTTLNYFLSREIKEEQEDEEKEKDLQNRAAAT